MKKLLPFVFTISFLVACSGSDDAGTTPPDEPVTYQADIRPIMQNHCVSCHGNPTANGAPMGLTTYLEVKDAVENRFLIDRINDTNNPMPESGLLPIATRALIEKWVNQGMPEN